MNVEKNHGKLFCRNNRSKFNFEKEYSAKKSGISENHTF